MGEGAGRIDHSLHLFHFSVPVLLLALWYTASLA